MITIIYTRNIYSRFSLKFYSIHFKCYKKMSCVYTIYQYYYQSNSKNIETRSHAEPETVDI